MKDEIDKERKQNKGFNYVDVIGKGCEGWINLFFDDYCLCLVQWVDIADNIKKVAQKRVSTIKPLTEGGE